MNQEIINEVLCQMIPHLSNDQIVLLKNVLEGAMLKSGTGSDQSDEVLVDSFIAAKRLEGCSERTLVFYKNTIDKMLASIGKNIKAVTTEDLRGYLSEYQNSNMVSKVTIDNIRRNLSSFFSWLEDENYILKSPVRRIHRVKVTTSVKETYTDEDLERLRDSCTELRDLAMYQGYPVKKIGELDIFVTDYVANGSFASLKENVIILEEKNYAYFIRNVDLKAKEFPRFVNQNSYEFLSKSKLVGGEVIISNVGDVGSVFLCPKLDGPMTLGNNMIMLTSPKHNNYLYLFFKSYIGQGKIGGITGGSAQPKFNKTDFKSLEINYPDESQVDEFNEKTSALLDMISKLDEENKRLTALRDSLLPKLMSGELDISDLDI